MLTFRYFLAAVSADPLNEGHVLEGEASKLFGYNVRDMVLLLGMAFILASALFLYAYVTRKKKRATIALANSRAIYRAEPDDDSEPRRHRKRRRRREHPEFLPRNPTLQETGGLPPLRPEEPAEPTQ
jgi:hypothetical protein